MTKASREPFLRHNVLRLQLPPRRLRPLPSRSSTPSRASALSPVCCAPPSMRCHQHLDRPQLRPLDAERATMKLPLALRFCLLLGLLRCTATSVRPRRQQRRLRDSRRRSLQTLRHRPHADRHPRHSDRRSPLHRRARHGILITPLPLTGEASKHPPTSDAMKRSADDPAFYTGRYG